MDDPIDALDRRILAALQAQARLSNLDLQKLVPLSHSAISRRIRRLEATGVIRGYHARVDPAAIGQSVRAFAAIHRQAEVPAMQVARGLQAIAGIAGCWIVSGDSDIMVEIVARDMAHFSAIMLDEIQQVRGVAATRSMFVLDTLKER